MKTLEDTPSRIKNKHISLIKKSGLWFRYKKTLNLSKEIFQLSYEGFKEANKNLDEKQLKLKFIKLLYNIEIDTKSIFD